MYLSIPIRALFSVEKSTEKCGFTLTCQLIRGCKVVANFATGQQPAHRRAHRRQRAAYQVRRSCGPRTSSQGLADLASCSHSRPERRGYRC
nr:MAG TPA: hypothetical protein [Caudoviricetes sp.]